MSCERGGRCGRRCDVVEVIRRYVDPLMDVASRWRHLKDYGLSRHSSTKCLNTAVLLMFLILGDVRSGRECDCRDVNDRNTCRVLAEGPGSGARMNRRVLSHLHAALTRSRGERAFYYVMLTDARFDDPTAYFPGHVFVIEDVGDRRTFRLFQSYVNAYPLTSREMRQSQTNEMLQGLEHVLTSDVWDEGCVGAWRDMTDVDTTDSFLGCKCDDRIFVCFTRLPSTLCAERVLEFVETSIQAMSREKSEKDRHMLEKMLMMREDLLSRHSRKK